MDLGLNNKVAFVAASSDGLGKAVALELAKEGATVIINGRNKEKLEKTKQEIELECQTCVLAISGDLADEKESIFAFFKRVITQPLNIKTANLTDEELGNVKIPVRTNLEISSYCKNMKMSAFSKCFEDDAQVILGS